MTLEQHKEFCRLSAEWIILAEGARSAASDKERQECFAKMKEIDAKQEKMLEEEAKEDV